VTEAPPTDRVVIAVDPHKASRTAAAVDASLQPLDIIRVPVSREGYRALRRPHAGPISAGRDGRGRSGAPLTQRLTADGCGRARQTRARVRVLSTGHGRKTDEADAVSVGIAALTATRLPLPSSSGHHPARPSGTKTTRGVSHPLLSLPSVRRK
jgi:transposase